MAEPEIGVGNIPLQLGADLVVLKPTTEACLLLCRAPGGLYGAGSIVDRLIRCDIDTMVFIIRAGANLPASVAVIRQMEKAVFEYGLVNLRDRLSEFVGIVANGGRPPETEEGGDQQDPPATASA